MLFCANCRDEFDPIEGASTDPDEPHFCSAECGDEYWDAVELQQAYEEGRYGGAEVF